MTVSRIKTHNVKDIARLHKKYINNGFLSMLGVSFLELIYKSMINCNTAICIIAETEKKIAGFISGSTDVGEFYKEFFKKQFFKSLIVVLPNLIKPRVARKICETMFYPKRFAKNLPPAELLSIVVNKNYRGKGIGELLFKRLVEEFRERNINSFKVVVGADLINASRFYEKMGGILHSEIEVHKDEKSKVYVWNI